MAVGTKSFVERVKEKLGIRAIGRKVVADSDGHQLKEPAGSYSPHFGGQMGLLSPKNTYNWDGIAIISTD